MFAWQGWQFPIPDGWYAVKLEGDRAAGQALIADLRAPRLGLRWTTPQSRFDGPAWSRNALRDEVGQLAADEARACPLPGWTGGLLYAEPRPPGRDVFVGRSGASGRLLECVRHVRAADDRPRLAEIVPTIADASPDDESPWSIFDLSCRTPAGYVLSSYALDAGDLGFSFRRETAGRRGGGGRIDVRQIAVAHLALKRKPLEGWIADAARAAEAEASEPEAIAIDADPVAGSAAGARALRGQYVRLRPRRPWWQRWGDPDAGASVLAALHDEARDRLLLIAADDLASAKRLARTVGWAEASPQDPRVRPTAPAAPDAETSPAPPLPEARPCGL